MIPCLACQCTHVILQFRNSFILRSIIFHHEIFKNVRKTFFPFIQCPLPLTLSVTVNIHNTWIKVPMSPITWEIFGSWMYQLLIVFHSGLSTTSTVPFNSSLNATEVRSSHSGSLPIGIFFVGLMIPYLHLLNMLMQPLYLSTETHNSLWFMRVEKTLYKFSPIRFFHACGP